jgi:hypothetical protein
MSSVWSHLARTILNRDTQMIAAVNREKSSAIREWN